MSTIRTFVGYNIRARIESRVKGGGWGACKWQYLDPERKTVLVRRRLLTPFVYCLKSDKITHIVHLETAEVAEVSPAAYNWQDLKRLPVDIWPDNPPRYGIDAGYKPHRDTASTEALIANPAPPAPKESIKDNLVSGSGTANTAACGISIQCRTCQKQFVPKHYSQRYCNDPCQSPNRRKKA